MLKRNAIIIIVMDILNFIKKILNYIIHSVIHFQSKVQPALSPVIQHISKLNGNQMCVFYNIYYLSQFSSTAQPPGVPEVCRKSLVSCPANGGLELYLLGKNFLKETRVVFRVSHDGSPWEEEVVPDKEFLQQVRLYCIKLL